MHDTRSLPDPELLVDARAQIGEGPVWDDRINRLIWVDILGQALHVTDPTNGATETVRTPSAVGVVLPRASGGYVAALEDGFWALDRDGHVEPIALVEADDHGTRFNDGACGPQGRLWAGTMAWDSAPGRGALYRLDPGGTVRLMVDDVTISNGLGWSADGRTMYYVDTTTRRIDAFDFDPVSGDIANRRAFVTIPESVGYPDGLAVDADGAVWLALWGGWAIHRYLPDGELEAVLRIPAAQVTSCAFGGSDLGDLFITCAWEDLTDEQRSEQPLAGGLFHARPGVRGIPRAIFAG